MVMAIGACSFLAPTAPAMAMAAETPQTAPPAPSVAARRWSRPSRVRDPVDHRKRHDRDDRRLQDRHRPGPDDKREGQRRAEQHDAGLDVELDAEAGVEPARQADQVRQHEADDQRHQRRLEIVGVGLVPLAEREDRDRQHIEERERRDEIPRLMPERGERDGEHAEPDEKLRDVAKVIGGKMRAELRASPTISPASPRTSGCSNRWRRTDRRR